MPWATPTLRTLRQIIRDNVTAALRAVAMVANSVTRVVADGTAGLTFLCMLYLDWLAKQLLPDTAETEWLDRHGNIWLVNADGSKGRKAAAFAAGSATFTGTVGVTIPQFSTLSNAISVQYQTQAAIVLGSGPTPGPVKAITPGVAGNMNAGDIINFVSAIAQVDGLAIIVDMEGGAEVESDDDLRARILQRIQNPPMGGSDADYEAWATQVSGVTRAWAAVEQGIGTITVRFLMDDLRASDDGWPTPADIQTVATYIDSVRPVTVKDCYVLAPIKQFISITIANLMPNTTEVQAEIESAMENMLRDNAAPGQTIYSAWISYAIMSAPNVVSFQLITTADFVMPSLGHMAVLQTILYT